MTSIVSDITENIQIMETEQYPEGWMHHWKKNQEIELKFLEKEWTWKHNIEKPMGYKENSSQMELTGIKYLH